MKKTFKLKNLGCANCAAKMERQISDLPHVNACNVVFMTCKMTVEAEEHFMDEVVEQAKSIIHKLEPNVELVRA